ncbi:MAG: hypothetical protein OXH38_05420 [Chloroflexi bacterium]|nr:hypothetical protein [Chloroflexota bacterium]
MKEIPVWIQWLLAVFTVAALVMGIWALVGGMQHEDETGTAHAAIIRRHKLVAGDLVRLRTDGISVYYVTRADDRTADLRHVQSWEDIEAASCGDRHIAAVVPIQDVRQFQPFEPGDFPKVHECSK